MKKINGGNPYNFTDIKTFLYKVKEDFESEFLQNLAPYEYDDLKSNFKIIIPRSIDKNEINELKIDFEFEGCCITKQDIQNNQ